MPKGYKGREHTERLHMLISPAELDQIDDWQHSNKVATRSDAVRRLVQIGLRSLKALPQIARDAADVLDMASEAIDIPQSVLAGVKVSGPVPSDSDREIARKLYDAVNFTFNRQIEAQDTVFGLVLEIAPLVDNPSLSEAIEAADRHAAGVLPDEERRISVGASRQPQVAKWRKRRERIQVARAKGRSAK